MKKLLLGLAVVAFALVLFRVTSVKASTTADHWGDWTYGECVANSCGTTEGTKQGTRDYLHYVDKTCEYTCEGVTEQFQASREVCPESDSAYTSHEWWKACKRKIGGVWHYADKVTETFGPITVNYVKSSDPNKCHKVTPETPEVPSWASSDFGKLPEFKNATAFNCVDAHWTVTDTQHESFKCEATLTECEGQCTTTCGYEGGRVPDGQGGYKTCPATNACEKECDDGQVLVDDECVTPTVTPSVTPSVTPTETPSVTPTPVVTEAPKQSSGGGDPNQGWHAPGPTDYSCHNDRPEKAVANFHLYRKGDVAELKWMPAGNNAPTVNIYYRLATSSGWEHSVIGTPNNGYFTITGLGTRDWTFAIAQNNGCIEGDMTYPVVDGNTAGWVLFR